MKFSYLIKPFKDKKTAKQCFKKQKGVSKEEIYEESKTYRFKFIHPYSIMVKGIDSKGKKYYHKVILKKS